MYFQSTIQNSPLGPVLHSVFESVEPPAKHNWALCHVRGRSGMFGGMRVQGIGFVIYFFLLLFALKEFDLRTSKDFKSVEPRPQDRRFMVPF